MKKIIWTLIIILLLGTGFRYVIFNTDILDNFLGQNATEEITETTVLTEADIFVNPNFCTDKHTREEYTAYRQQECQTTNSCEQRQQDVSGIVFADWNCFYSGEMIIEVLDTSKVASEYTSLIDQGIAEIQNLGKLPKLLYHNLLETEIGFDAGFLDDTFELTGTQISGTDISRVFISMEGQDLMLPVLNIIVKKWNFIVSIKNDLFNNQYGNTQLQPVIDQYSTWTNGKVEAMQFSGWTFPPSETWEFYHQNIETNQYYQTLLQDKLAAALNLFVTE